MPTYLVVAILQSSLKWKDLPRPWSSLVQGGDGSGRPNSRTSLAIVLHCLGFSQLATWAIQAFNSSYYRAPRGPLLVYVPRIGAVFALLGGLLTDFHVDRYGSTISVPGRT